MRLSVGFKIFGIAIFLALALVMVVASITADLRIRDAAKRVGALATVLIPLSDRIAEVQASALREEVRILKVIGLLHVETTAKSSAEDDEARIEEDDERVRQAIREALAIIERGSQDLSSEKQRLAMVRLDEKFQVLTEHHENLHLLSKNIIDGHGAGTPGLAEELIKVFQHEQEVFDQAAAATVKVIQDLVESEALFAKEQEEAALNLNLVVTAGAAMLGLVLAGFLVRALVGPLRHLLEGTKAIESGDLSQHITVTSRDELGDLAASFNAMAEELRLKEKTKEIFGRYVDPRVVEELIGSSGSENEIFGAGEKTVATVFFSDIEGFTSFSERLSPVGLVRLMNEYFSLASKPILDRQGLIDKFIGDAVMAFWCPPFAPAERQSQLACLAALAEFDQLLLLEQRLPDLLGLRSDLPRIDIRIGLATGEVVVGSVGSEQTKDFTVMGDSVNLGSRLSDANKIYGTRILICEQTREAAGDTVEAREIDLIAVMGKNVPVRVFELLCPAGGLSPLQEKGFAAFARGLAGYRAGDWSKAEEGFQLCLQQLPEDPPAQVFLRRLASLRDTPPGGDWDGVWRVTSK
jgi:class 3 adenylate cyclase